MHSARTLLPSERPMSVLRRSAARNRRKPILWTGRIGAEIRRPRAGRPPVTASCPGSALAAVRADASGIGPTRSLVPLLDAGRVVVEHEPRVALRRPCVFDGAHSRPYGLRRAPPGG